MKYELSPMDVELMAQNNRHLGQMMALAADRNRWKRLALISVPVMAALFFVEAAIILWAVR
jgi:hypothetical protein